MKTMKIMNINSEFKDGDIVVTDAVPSMCYSKCIFILKGDLNTDESHANSYVFYNISNNYINFDVLDTTIRDRNIHCATEEEKHQLFNALAKQGKTWDTEKKQIMNIKKEHQFKPFDKIVVYADLADVWTCEIFSHYSKDYQGNKTIVCLGGVEYYKALPFNEETAELLGTTKGVEK